MTKTTNQPTAPVVAWRATSESGKNKVILFSAGEPGEKEFDHYDNIFVSLEEGTRIERAPELDQYAATQRVPPQVLLDNGDGIICHGCDASLPNYGPFGRPNLSPPAPIVDGHFAYCDEHCRDNSGNHRARREAVESFMMFKQRLVYNFLADLFGSDFYDRPDKVRFIGGDDGDVWLKQGRNKWLCRVDWSGNVTVIDYRLGAPFVEWLEARTRTALNAEFSALFDAVDDTNKELVNR